jgi:hypothetical protein
MLVEERDNLKLEIESKVEKKLSLCWIYVVTVSQLRPNKDLTSPFLSASFFF